jgi:hypothetical protein
MRTGTEIKIKLNKISRDKIVNKKIIIKRMRSKSDIKIKSN